jgi:hypothetical protein
LRSGLITNTLRSNSLLKDVVLSISILACRLHKVVVLCNAGDLLLHPIHIAAWRNLCLHILKIAILLNLLWSRCRVNLLLASNNRGPTAVNQTELLPDLLADRLIVFLYLKARSNRWLIKVLIEAFLLAAVAIECFIVLLLVYEEHLVVNWTWRQDSDLLVDADANLLDEASFSRSRDFVLHKAFPFE